MNHKNGKMKSAFDHLWPSLFAMSKEMEGIKTNIPKVPRVVLTKLTGNQIARLSNGQIIKLRGSGRVSKSQRGKRLKKSRRLVIHSDSDSDDFIYICESGDNDLVSDSSEDMKQSKLAGVKSPQKENTAPDRSQTFTKDKVARLSDNVDPEILKMVAATLSKENASNNSVDSFIKELAKESSSSLVNKSSISNPKNYLNFDAYFEIAHRSIKSDAKPCAFSHKNVNLLGDKSQKLTEAEPTTKYKAKAGNSVADIFFSRSNINVSGMKKKGSDLRKIKDAVSSFKPASKKNCMDLSPVNKLIQNSDSEKKAFEKDKFAADTNAVKKVQPGPFDSLIRGPRKRNVEIAFTPQEAGKKGKLAPVNMVSIPSDSLASHVNLENIYTDNVSPLEESSDAVSYSKDHPRLANMLKSEITHKDARNEFIARKEIDDNSIVVLPLKSVIRIEEEKIEENTLEIETVEDLNGINKALDNILDKLKKHKLELEREYDEEAKKLKQKYDSKLEDTEKMSREFRLVAIAILDEKQKKRPDNKSPPNEKLKIKIKDLFSQTSSSDEPHIVEEDTPLDKSKDLDGPPPSIKLARVGKIIPSSTSGTCHSSDVSTENKLPADAVASPVEISPKDQQPPSTTVKKQISTRKGCAFTKKRSSTKTLIRPIPEAHLEYFGKTPEEASSTKMVSRGTSTLTSSEDTHARTKSGSDTNSDKIEIPSALTCQLTECTQPVNARTKPVSDTNSDKIEIPSALTSQLTECTQPVNMQVPLKLKPVFLLNDTSTTVDKLKRNINTAQKSVVVLSTSQSTVTTTAVNSPLTTAVTKSSSFIKPTTTSSFAPTSSTGSSFSITISKKPQLPSALPAETNKLPTKTTFSRIPKTQQPIASTQQQLSTSDNSTSNFSNSQQFPKNSQQQSNPPQQQRISLLQQCLANAQPLQQFTTVPQQQNLSTPQQQSNNSQEQNKTNPRRLLPSAPQQHLLGNTLNSKVNTSTLQNLLSNNQQSNTQPQRQTHIQVQPVGQRLPQYTILSAPTTSIQTLPSLSLPTFQSTAVQPNVAQQPHVTGFYQIPQHIQVSQGCQPVLINRTVQALPYQQAVHSQYVQQQPQQQQQQVIYQPQPVTQYSSPNIPQAEVDKHGNVFLKQISTFSDSLDQDIFNLHHVRGETILPNAIDTESSGQSHGSSQMFPIITSTVSLANKNNGNDFDEDNVDLSGQACFLCGRPATIFCCGQFVYCESGCKEDDWERHKHECRGKKI